MTRRFDSLEISHRACAPIVACPYLLWNGVLRSCFSSAAADAALSMGRSMNAGWKGTTSSGIVSARAMDEVWMVTRGVRVPSPPS
jgi:hypothetical protein